MSETQVTALIVASAALFGALIGSIPAILSLRAENKRWRQEQQGAKIEKITNAAAQVIITASPVHTLTPSVLTKSSGDPRLTEFWAAFANWELVIFPYATEEQKEQSINDRVTISRGEPDAFMISHKVMLVTHDIVSKIQDD